MAKCSLVIIVIFLSVNLPSTCDARKLPAKPEMHKDNPNIRHVPRGPPPPHPGRLDKNPPPRERHKEPEKGDTLPPDIAELSYEKYLREVTRILESDPDFKKRMHNATREEVMTGKLADQLNFASHHVRSQLDEAKRREVERLRTEFKEIQRLSNDERSVHEDFIRQIAAHMPAPMKAEDVNKFSVDDLNHLIHTVTRDLDEIDKKRREQYKEHEMRMELERRKQMEKMTPEEKAQKEREHEAEMKKMKDHPRMHEPGHKANLEEVWQEQDHLDKDQFNPKTFFQLHDMNGDGNLDELELEALFVKEVETMYAEAAKDSNVNKEELEIKKEEEMARMREHVMTQVDLNKDRVISYEEFEKFTKGKEFETDDEWKGVADEEPFNEEELKKYEAKLEEEAKELERKKQKLREFKEKKGIKDATKPPETGGGVHRPPPDDFYYDADGEQLTNYDAKIDYYDDFDPEFEEM